MSIFSIVTSGFSKMRQYKHVSNAMTGVKGLGTAGVYTASAGFGYMSYERDYGAGAGVLIGIGEVALMSNPYGFIAGMGLYAGKYAYETGIQTFNRNRKLNMGKQMTDNYGNINKMRQYSISQLSRDRSAISRTIGNEAAMLHKRRG